MNIDIHKYPINVFYSKVSVLEHTIFKDQILSMIDKYPEEVEGSKYFSKLDWKSSKDPEREWTKLASSFINTYNNIIGSGTGYSDPVIIDIWFQQYKKLNRHPWHIHGGQFVGVYYVELPEDAPRTQLVPSWNQNEIIDVDVKEGDILIFPSMLVHQASTINTDLRKTIISWNLVYENPAQQVMESLDNAIN